MWVNPNQNHEIDFIGAKIITLNNFYESWRIAKTKLLMNKIRDCCLVFIEVFCIKIDFYFLILYPLI